MYIFPRKLRENRETLTLVFKLGDNEIEGYLRGLFHDVRDNIVNFQVAWWREEGLFIIYTNRSIDYLHVNKVLVNDYIDKYYESDFAINTY